MYKYLASVSLIHEVKLTHLEEKTKCVLGKLN